MDWCLFSFWNGEFLGREVMVRWNLVSVFSGHSSWHCPAILHWIPCLLSVAALHVLPFCLVAWTSRSVG